MTTAAAIDRVVHHAQILEMTGGSIRDEEAKSRAEAEKKKPKREGASDPKPPRLDLGLSTRRPRALAARRSDDHHPGAGSGAPEQRTKEDCMNPQGVHRF